MGRFLFLLGAGRLVTPYSWVPPSRDEASKPVATRGEVRLKRLLDLAARL